MFPASYGNEQGIDDQIHVEGGVRDVKVSCHRLMFPYDNFSRSTRTKHTILATSQGSGTGGSVETHTGCRITIVFFVEAEDSVRST